MKVRLELSPKVVVVSGWALVCAGLACCMLLAGCGSSLSAVGGGGSGSTAGSFRGSVFAGGRAASSASVQLYEASERGYGAAALPLLATPVVTDAAGSFTISGNQYTCGSSSSQLYLVASGGNGNSAQVLLTALGDCGGIAANASFTVNEVTTVATAWALAPFAKSPTAIGTSATNAAGLQHAFALAAMMADRASGVSPASALPSGLAISSAKIYSVANSLAVCAVGPVGACSGLFSAATVGGSVPTSSAGAALAIAQHPGSNVGAIFLAGSGSATYSGVLTAPFDWAMTIESTAGGLASPTGIALDSQGRAWVANEAGGLVLYDAKGVPVFANPITGHGLGGIIVVAVDSQDNVWAGNDATSTVTEISASGSVLSTGNGYGPGYRVPLGLAGDANGSMWLSNYDDATLYKLSSTGAVVVGPYNGPVLNPESVALDAAGTPWVAGQAGTVAHRDAQGNVTAYTVCCVNVTGISIDSKGNPWVSDFGAAGVAELSPTTGAAVRTVTGVGGLSSPNNISIDGDGNVWVPNFHGNSFSGVAGEGSSSPGQALSPSTGFGRDASMAAPFTTAVDASGTLWVTSSSDNRLVRFVGIAAPTKTPLLGPAALP